MKKFKSMACLILAMLTLLTAFATTASAATLPQSATLHITKYEVTDSTGEVELDTIIGNSASSTGVQQTVTGKETLDGVTFTIYKVGDLNTAAPKQPDVNDFTKVTTVTTANGGKADFTVNADEFGLYYVVETDAPDYVTTVSVPFFVYLPMTNTTDDGYMTDVYAYPKNYIPLGGAKLQKLDGETPLKGVKFELYKKDGSKVTADYFGNAITTFVTDDKGYIEVSNLPVGDYYFLETETLDGYILKTDKYNFTVSATKIGVQTLTPVQNSTQPQIIKFVTKDDNYEDCTSFNEFDKAKQHWIIYAGVPADIATTTYTNYTITDNMDDLLHLVDSSVKVYAETASGFEELDKTDYTVNPATKDYDFAVDVTDISALKNATRVKVEYDTTLDSSAVIETKYYNDCNLIFKASNTPEYEVGLTQKPYVYTGGYKFVKTNASNQGLANAEFNLYVHGGTTPIKTGLKSSANGTFEIKGLAYGKYDLLETKAPLGYELRADRITFEVKAGSYDAAATAIINQATPQLPITGGMGTVIFTVAGLGLITLSVVFFVASKKSKKED